MSAPTQDPDSMHAYGFHDETPDPACAHCREGMTRLAAAVKRKRENRHLAIGIGCLIAGFILAVILIGTFA